MVRRQGFGRGVSDAELAAQAKTQHGLVTTPQAERLLTPDQVRYRVRTGRLERVLPGVLRVSGAPEGWEPAVMAAVLGAGDGAVASFRAAAHLWSLAGFWEPPPVEVTTPSRWRVRIPDVVVHDSEVLHGLHVDRRHGIPVTSVARTLCDLTACASANQVGRALDDALRRKLVSLRRVREVFADLETRGRRRSTAMRALLEERGPAYQPGGSDPEVRMIRVLAAAGLPGLVPQHRVRVDGKTYRLDAAIVPYRVGFEYEGFDFHTGRTAFDDRYERDRLLKRARWLIVYVTSRTTDAQLVRDAYDALASRGFPGPPVLPLDPSM